MCLWLMFARVEGQLHEFQAPDVFMCFLVMPRIRTLLMFQLLCLLKIPFALLLTSKGITSIADFHIGIDIQLHIL